MNFPNYQNWFNAADLNQKSSSGLFLYYTLINRIMPRITIHI